VESRQPGPQPWFFDVWSTFYDFPLVQRLTYRPVQDAVMRELRAAGSRRVLDLGCGTGLLTRRLASDHPEVEVVGCDFSAGMLAQARRRTPTLRVVRATASALPLRDGVFDAVVSTEAFHWFPDQPRALAECFRVLAPGGCLVVALVNVPAERMSRVVHAASRAAGQPFYWPTAERMRAMVAAAGFRVTAQRRVFRVPAGLLLPPVLTVAVRPS
jgi:ubiquinone/menaquinone biosynthesis C-methylase UbiE